MNPKIRVITDHVPELPERVYWRHECESNDESWQCVLDIADWLKQNNIEYYVTAFQVNQSSMTIPSDEARTLIRLTWPLLVESYSDDYMDPVWPPDS